MYGTQNVVGKVLLCTTKNDQICLNKIKANLAKVHPVSCFWKKKKERKVDSRACRKS